jgi:hypothetical protein
MIKLVHGQQVKVGHFRWKKGIFVNSLKACVAERGGDYEETCERELKNFGYINKAWTYQEPTVVLSHYDHEEIAKKAIAYENAQFLHSGDQVEIEGEVFTVFIAGENYSDPVHFRQ